MLNWLSLIAGICYVVIGIAVIVYKFFIITVEPEIAYPLGGLLILYGIFRFVRAIIKIRTPNEDQ